MSIIIENCDCLEGMKRIADKSIDLILTDIPFNVNLKYASYKDNLTDDQYKDIMAKWFSEMARISNKRCVVKVPTKNLHLVLDIFDKIMGYKWTCVQYSPNTTGCGYTTLALFTLYLISSGQFNNKPKVDFFTNTQNNLTGGHPAEMPVAPIKWLINSFTTEGDLVCDPFLGSGTTAVACKELNRNFIGFEIEKKYYDIAMQRLAHTEEYIFAKTI